MQQYCDLKIEVMRPNQREIEKLQKYVLRSDWGGRVNRRFGWPIFVMTRRLDTDKYANIILKWILKNVRRITKKVIRVSLSYNWWHEYKGKK